MRASLPLARLGAALLGAALLVPPLFVASAACAQDEGRAAGLRAEGHRATVEGRLPEAYAAYREAAHLTEDPSVLLELAEAADRLRIDEVALASYVAFLEARPAAADRAELEGRVAVLRRIVRGHRFGSAETGAAVNLVVDWHGQPIVSRHVAARAERRADLVSWEGSPLRQEATVAASDGSLVPASVALSREGATRVASADGEVVTTGVALAPWRDDLAADDTPRGLGRRLTDPR